MLGSNSTLPVPSGKPAKPTPDYPLFPHASGQWAKKIRGKLHYFGKWADPDAALDNYNKQKDDLHAGRKPRTDAGTPEGITVNQVASKFINAKLRKVASGELAPRTYRGYKEVTDRLSKHFGKGRLVADLRPDDFAALRKCIASQWGFHGVGRFVQVTRSMFKFALENELLDRPVRFGSDFTRPSKKSLRLHRAKQGLKMFTASEVRRLIDAAATPAMKAMLLLGINAGFGNADCGTLLLSAVDLDSGIIDFPRPKTGIPRRCILWPETVEAIREALAKRKTPKREEDTGLVFLTAGGGSWAKPDYTSPIVYEVAKLLRKLGINGRKGLGFYTLRHTFRTVADESKDQPATDFIMGHEVPHMSAVYRETISDERLRAVADHVRRWLFPTVGKIECVK